MLIQVAVGIVINSANEILITQRPLDKNFGGFWEFPGGKIEPLEDGLTALSRELHEEVGISVLTAEYLSKISYKLEANTIILSVYKVLEFKGHAVCCESQLDLKWVRVDELFNYNFPPANKKILEILAPRPIFAQ